jgi:hypothetical protein
MTSFGAHIKMWMSKKKAKQRIEQLEREAAEEDKKAASESGKLRKRNVNWEIITSRE